VRPFARAGAVVSFGVRRERGLLLQLRLEDGSPLAAGALVQVEGESARYVVASGGEVYLPAATGRIRLVASWSGQSCSLEVEVPDNDDPQPRLAGLVCRRVATYAAR
jgi:outer membrane usher protein